MPETRYVSLFPVKTAKANPIPRHYSYECKAVAQERPYVSRPSRTQQLLNPKLLPKLASDAPQDLLRKKGVADEQLAKIEQERDRKRDQVERSTGAAKKLNHSRSTSSSSSASVATISTGASKESQTRRNTQVLQGRSLSFKSHMETHERKRRRTSSSDGSISFEMDRDRRGPDMSDTRNTRRKLGKHSPLVRGRRKSRTDSGSRQTSYSGSGGSPDRLSPIRDFERIHNLEIHNVAGSYSSGEDRRSIRRAAPEADSQHQNSRDGSRSPSRRSRRKQAKLSEAEERQKKAADSNSMRHPRDRSFSGDNLGRRRNYDPDDRSGTDTKFNARGARRLSQDSKPIRGTPREKSLSPFSKRLALTQAMNTSR